MRRRHLLWEKFDGGARRLRRVGPPGGGKVGGDGTPRARTAAPGNRYSTPTRAQEYGELMSEQPGSRAYGGANRHHKPKPFAPIDFEPFAGGGADPARVSEAAHLAAQALVRRGRDSDDPQGHPPPGEAG